MTVIARDECPEHGVRSILAGRCHVRVRPYVFCLRDAVTVEYVPAEQLRGAVGDRDTLAAYLRWVVYKTGGAAPITYAEMEALLDRLSTAGGQSGG